MPKDPAWMHWARSCSAIAQAIIENFWVEKIIPSDSNTIKSKNECIKTS